MHIVIDCRMILPQMTGVGRYLTGLAGAYRNSSQDDLFELWLQQDLPPEHPILRTESGNIHLRRLSIQHMDIRSQWIVPLELRKTSPDLYHYPHFDLPWLSLNKIVATIHDLKYIAHPRFFPHVASAKRLLIKNLTKFTCWRAQQVITDSQSTAKDLIRYLKLPRQKITVIPLGVERRFFEPRTTEDLTQFKRRYQLSNPFVLFVGERRPHKNIVGLIEAFEMFRHMVKPPFELVIAGKPYSDYRLPEQMVEKLELGKSLRFLDSVPDDDLPMLYSCADVFVSLSLYEGFGLPVLEAMASGVPVVSSHSTSHPEVVGEAGILVPVHHPEQTAIAIQKVMSGGELREQYIQRGLERARQFTWEKCAQRTITVYHQVVGQ